ncbi:SRPBCC family protein [Micromonospora rubida]|uniref:SRPBCC family protein n=1 Tax=Micromonospora rubida TaxID=2697657 RepID=UPI0013788C56|nr:SRPBCC family protein [Micromonospora rubida]NBE79705.1 molecular chaperone Hsp90 [Micromonospora rubida]
MLYSGPSLDHLHEHYAKQGRIDDYAAVKASQIVMIDAPVRTVWHVLATPATWSRIDPTIRDVTMIGAVAPDTPFSWTNGKAKIESRFAVVRPDAELSWTGVSFGARAVHRHQLQRRADAGTDLEIHESMAGPLLGLFFDTAKLQEALVAWAEGIKRVAQNLHINQAR